MVDARGDDEGDAARGDDAAQLRGIPRGEDGERDVHLAVREGDVPLRVRDRHLRGVLALEGVGGLDGGEELRRHLRRLGGGVERGEARGARAGGVRGHAARRGSARFRARHLLQPPALAAAEVHDERGRGGGGARGGRRRRAARPRRLGAPLIRLDAALARGESERRVAARCVYSRGISPGGAECRASWSVPVARAFGIFHLAPGSKPVVDRPIGHIFSVRRMRVAPSPVFVFPRARVRLRVRLRVRTHAVTPLGRVARARRADARVRGPLGGGDVLHVRGHGAAHELAHLRVVPRVQEAPTRPEHRPGIARHADVFPLPGRAAREQVHVPLPRDVERVVPGAAQRPGPRALRGRDAVQRAPAHGAREAARGPRRGGPGRGRAPSRERLRARDAFSQSRVFAPRRPGGPGGARGVYSPRRRRGTDGAQTGDASYPHRALFAVMQSARRASARGADGAVA